jgi:hemoglobin/transferrin/lactoferrin receptor protein
MKLNTPSLSVRPKPNFGAWGRAAFFGCFVTLLAPFAYSQTTISPNLQPVAGPVAAPAKTSTSKGGAKAAAQTTPSQASEKKLGEIVVVATRTPQEKSKTAASVSTYSAQDILNNNISSPQELIQNDVGVSAARSVGGGGMTLLTTTGVEDYNIRGLDENRVLLIEDGIRANDIFSFQGNEAQGRDFYDFDALKNVEIIKSAASALYGGGAIGGVVSYTTKDPSDYLSLTKNPWYAGYKESFDSSDFSFSETATFAARTGPVEYLLLYTRRDGQQTSISADPATEGPAGANPLDWSQNNFLGKIVYHLDDQNQLRLTGEYFNYRGNSDLISATYPSAGLGGMALGNGFNTDDTEDRDRVSLDYQFTGKPNLDVFKNIQASVYYQQTESKQNSTEDQDMDPFGIFGADPDDIYRTDEYKTSILGGNLQMTQDASAWGVNNEFTYGGDVSYSTQNDDLQGLAVDQLTGATTPFDGTEVYPRSTIPPSYTTRLGAFGQDQIKFDDVKWLTLTPALRLDYYDMEVSDSEDYLTASGGIPAVPYRQFSVTPSFSALAQITKELNVYGNFAEGYRNPDTEDLNATFTNTPAGYEVIPNPNLKSEQSYDFEVGVHGNYDPIKFSVAGFYNIYKNFINDQVAATGVPLPVGIGQAFQSQNIPNAEIHGVEVSAELPLGYYVPSLEGFKILSLAAYTSGEDETDHTYLPNIDPLKIVNTLHYTSPGNKWGVDLVGTWVDSQGEVPNNPTPAFVPPAYYTIDLVGRYRFNENVELTAGVYNLTDQTYFLYQTTSQPEVASSFDGGGIARYSEPGINARAGLTIHF